MLLDPLYYSFGDKEQKCWGGVQVNVGGGGAKHVGGGGGARMKLANKRCYLTSFVSQKMLNNKNCWTAILLHHLRTDILLRGGGGGVHPDFFCET